MQMFLEDQAQIEVASQETPLSYPEIPDELIEALNISDEFLAKWEEDREKYQKWYQDIVGTKKVLSEFQEKRRLYNEKKIQLEKQKAVELRARLDVLKQQLDFNKAETLALEREIEAKKAALKAMGIEPEL